MNADISRRDFLNGASLAIGASLLPQSSVAQDIGKQDIAAITVNRWPHGYAYGYDPATDRVAFEPAQWPEEKRSWVKGSRRFGNISIAATDAASNAMTESAIEEAHRAVEELR